MGRIADNLAAVRERIAAAGQRSGRQVDRVRLIAVTKTQEHEVLAELAEAGVWDVGENRIDHLATMAAAAPDGMRFHYIGRVQGRQLGKLLPLCRSLHSLCELRHVDRLGRLCEGRSEPFPVFLQVNTAGEDQKAGLSTEGLAEALDRVAGWSGLTAVGLMCMAPDRGLAGVDDDRVRRSFARLRTLGEQYGLERLSMGMSGDFELAVEEGATELRIGSALFA